jgi:hypothetical protein
MKRKDPFKALPTTGEVWASKLQFSLREGGVGLRPGLGKNADGDYVPVACEGVEVRTVVGVVSFPGHQRRVAYTRQFHPDGHAPFGKTGLQFTAISAFNRWRRGTTRAHMQPAQMLELGTIDKAIAILKEQAAGTQEARAA